MHGPYRDALGTSHAARNLYYNALLLEHCMYSLSRADVADVILSFCIIRWMDGGDGGVVETVELEVVCR